MRDTPNTEAIIVEYGFLDSTGDDVNQLKNNWEKYAEAVVRALTSYVGGTYIPLVGSGYYVVKKGDSLWSIAKTYGTSIDALKELNNLTSNMLSVGQTLKIPGDEELETPSNEYISYQVKAGDSLYSIANKYDVTVNELINYNNLSSIVLSIGQVIRIPNTMSNTYIVVAGDSLYGIATKYGVAVSELKKANNLSSNTLSIGQKLIIPGSDNSSSGYTVVAGDNLYSIARKYGTTVNEIKSLNGLTSNNLSIGQVLKIPGKSEYITYTVKAGDNLYRIAQTYKTTVSEIIKLNNLVTSSLVIGQTLLLPDI